MEGKILIADSMHDSIFAMLKEAKLAYDYQPDISSDGLRTQLAGYTGLIIRSKAIVDRELLGDRPQLKFVARAGAGLDNVDVDWLTSVGVQVIHAAEGNRDAVGEFTVGLTLSLMRNIPRADRGVRHGVWDREGNRGEELNGKTVGIIGYGNMGRSAAMCLSGFGCKILAYDKYKSGFGTSSCNEGTLESIFEQADLLSLHIPLTPETRGMVDRTFLHRFSKNIILVNTARGEIVQLSHLAECLESGKVRGAALDVLENEKLSTLTNEQQQSFNKLKARSNVIFTPHIAGWTYESHVKINVVLVEKIKSLGL